MPSGLKLGFRGCWMAALLSVPAWSGEIVFLTSGARLAADRHEISGDFIRLIQGTGSTELPSALVLGFEALVQAPNLAEIEAPNAETAMADGTPTANSVPSPELPQVAAPSVSTDVQVLLREAAVRAGLPPAFVASVAKVESAFRPNAISPKGAIGVMQLMPDTARALGADPHDLRQNIDAGARLLRDLLLKYEGDVVKTLAAYNAGEAAVARYHGLPPFLETQYYVNKVIGAYQRFGGK